MRGFLSRDCPSAWTMIGRIGQSMIKRPVVDDEGKARGRAEDREGGM